MSWMGTASTYIYLLSSTRTARPKASLQPSKSHVYFFLLEMKRLDVRLQVAKGLVATVKVAVMLGGPCRFVCA